MSRLIHINGPPGIGKSTLAQRYVDDHPGVLNCDIDVLRTLVGGWQHDFDAASALIRPVALGMISAYLRNGHDVVLPQLLVALSELEKFEAAAREVGSAFIECVLMDDVEPSLSRFYRRGGEGTDSAWHAQVTAVVAANGGDDLLIRLHKGLRELLTHRPNCFVISSVEGRVDDTYRSLVDALHS